MCPNGQQKRLAEKRYYALRGLNDVSAFSQVACELLERATVTLLETT
jgi:hypothetical protein